MELSVIIVNYKTEKLTLSCLRSLDKYPYKEKFEVIVVDNGSSDGSIEKIERFKPAKYSLVIIKNSVNAGFSKANNIGIKKAKGEYLLLLNSDAEVIKNSLIELVEFAKAHSDAGIVAPRLLNTDKTIQPSVFNFPTVIRAFNQYILGGKKILDKYTPKSNHPTNVEVVVGACFLISPRALKLVGMLDERYFMYFEDFDYCRSVRKSGLKVYYLPHTKVIHVHGGSNKSNPEQFKRLVAASKIYHGMLNHYVIQIIIKIGRRIRA